MPQSRPAPHRMPTRCAPCTDPVRIMRRGRPHHVPIRSAPCADTLRITSQ
ncbi:MAG: hypothetical protein K2G76_07110 [Prevotella sp.]|nr:hypothetical protein [Prevotella sp.]